jgi:hypothetical protein
MDIIILRMGFKWVGTQFFHFMKLPLREFEDVFVNISPAEVVRG